MRPPSRLCKWGWSVAAVPELAVDSRIAPATERFRARRRSWPAQLLYLWNALAWWAIPLALLATVAVGQRTTSIEAFRITRFDTTRCVPTEDAGWQERRLPVRLQGDCWYFKASIAHPGLELEGAGLMLFGLHENAAVYVNGLRLRDLPELDGRSHYSTMLGLPIGSGALSPGLTELLIEARARPTEAARVNLGAAFFGPQELLRTHEQRHQRLQGDGARLALVLIASVLMFLVPIAIRRQGDLRHRWFVLALLGSAVYVLHFASTWRALGQHSWGVVIHTGLLVSLWASLRFSSEMLQRPPPRASGALALLAMLALLATRFPGMPAVATLAAMSTYRILLLVLLLVLARIWWQGRRSSVQPGGRWFAAAALLVAVLGAFDGLRATLGAALPSIGYSLHWGILYLTVLMFVALLFEMMRALDLARRSERELAEQLSVRSRELEAEFQRRRSAEAERTLAEERQRIMRDMHDGVGGQLVALIAQVESGKTQAASVAAHLKRTLEDLRLMIDSLDPACADLSVALGMLRGRLAPMLAGLPVSVHWRTAHLPDLPPAPPSTVLHVMRVLQEALTNALKHAQARTLQVTAEWADGLLILSVADDGLGIDSAQPAGRGLASMRTRAQAIGGELQVESGATGTRVSLKVPLRP